MAVTLICQREGCSRPFSVRPYRAGIARYCSITCLNLMKRKRPTFVCSACGKDGTSDDFFKDNQKPRGYVSRCKECYQRQANVIRFEKPYRREMEIKLNAKNRDIDWDLTREQFMSFWLKPCFYCGGDIPTVGLDRIDNSKGYVFENLVPCCGLCNRMKSVMSIADFVDHCGNVVRTMTANASIACKGR